MNIPLLVKWAKEQKDNIDQRKDSYDDIFRLEMWAHFKMINDQGLEIIKFEKDIEQRRKQIGTSLLFLDKHGAKQPNDNLTRVPEHTRNSNS